MKHIKRVISTIGLSSLMFLTICSPNVNAMDSANDIPVHIQKQIDQKVDSNHFELPEIKAWISDPNGNIISECERKDLSVKNGLNRGDGLSYYFYKYDVDDLDKDWNYKSVGTFRFKNDTKDSVAHVQYTQQETEEVDWNVTSNIEGEAEVSAGFLGKVKAKAGVSVGKNKKWSKGRSYGTTYDVNPGNTIYLTNYQVGYNANGSIKWKRYSHGGTFLGYYSESAGGTVLSKSDLNIELTD